MKRLTLFALFVMRALCGGVPPTFGKSHFIVGMPAEQTAQAKPVSHSCDATVPFDLLCNGDLPQVFFSPHDDLRKALVYLIDHEKKAIRIAAYALTDAKIVATLLSAQKRGVEVRILVDRSCLQLKGSKARTLKKAGVCISFFDGEVHEDGALMHNKFVLFTDNFMNKSLVWTGSANITNAACAKNHENVVVLDTVSVCNRYREEFDRLENQARRFVES